MTASGFDRQRDSASRTATAADRLRGHLRECANWRLLAMLFERPRKGWHDELEALVHESGDPELADALAEAGYATEGDYLSVLGPGGLVSPREVAYRGIADPGRTLADLGAFYLAFAYHPRVEEPPDHAAVEIGFIAYLRMKVAYAEARGDRNDLETTSEALERFVGEHLGIVAAALEARLRAVTLPRGAAHLPRAARILSRWLPESAGEHAAGEVRDATIPIQLDGTEPLACPGC